MFYLDAFIVLLGGLYVISGGILLRGDLEATPLTNATFLAVGTAIASFVVVFPALPVMATTLGLGMSLVGFMSAQVALVDRVHERAPVALRTGTTDAEELWGWDGDDQLDGGTGADSMLARAAAMRTSTYSPASPTAC